MTDLHPGELVVCVDAADTNAWQTQELVRGRVYTIRAVVEPDDLMSAVFRRPLGEPGVLLVEVRREIDPEYGEWPFGAYRFRPLGELSREELPAEVVSA